MRESTKNWQKEKAQTRQRNYEGNQPKTTTKEDLERKKFLFMACLANLPTIPLASLNVCNETWQPLHTHIATYGGITMWGFLGPYILNLKSTLKSLNVSFFGFQNEQSGSTNKWKSSCDWMEKCYLLIAN